MSNRFVENIARKQAEQLHKEVKAKITELVKEREAIKSRYPHGNPAIRVPFNHGEMKFVTIGETPTKYVVGTAGEVTELEPVTKEIYENLNEGDKAAFDMQFPAHKMALAHGFYNINPDMVYFQYLIAQNGQDERKFLLNIKPIPKLPEGAWSFDLSKYPDIAKHYDSEEDYKEGLTKEMKEYVNYYTTEGRIKAAETIETINDTIKGIEKTNGVQGLGRRVTSEVTGSALTY